MTGPLDDLYREVLMDHSKSPRNFREQDCPPARQGAGYNPLCGDKATVYVTIEDGAVADASFVGEGCAICMASASTMTQRIKGMELGELRALFDRFHDMLTEKDWAGDTEGMKSLAAFEGVRRFPMRVKCATLPWHALNEALGGADNPGA
jgi:nitrogen fixation NifU-like protein